MEKLKPEDVANSPRKERGLREKGRERDKRDEGVTTTRRNLLLPPFKKTTNHIYVFLGGEG